MSTIQSREVDVVLVGAGIMSATLGLLINELSPGKSIEIFEKLDQPAKESSDAWNNAGTGHSAFCELNYTTETPKGVDISKAVNICEQFEISRQFWSYLVDNNKIDSPKSFINTVPHMSLVWGETNTKFLRNRYDAMQTSPLFSEMEYSESANHIEKWAPLIMRGRSADERVAATHMGLGTDVNFGSLTRMMIKNQQKESGFNVTYNSEVTDLKKQNDGRWKITIKKKGGQIISLLTKFIFVGAGGASILLLKKSGIPEGKHYGGFPVSGQWLICKDDKLAQQHNAKVYGKASVGAPPMSVPHLDTRYIDGKRSLLFGPYAGFSTKFLKTGSYWDLFKSIGASNISTMLGAGMKNMDLTQYLIKEVLQSQDKRIASLQDYFPDAQGKDWYLEIAGQRVQTMKKNAQGKAELAFGTEVVSSADGSFSVLLGASPGASTTVSIMLGLLQKCFPKEYQSDTWQKKFKEMVPSFGMKLHDHPELLIELRNKTAKSLQLNE